MAILYQDEKITCDEDGLTIKGYYFPLPTEKRVLYSDLEKIEYYPLTTHTGKYKYWGGTFKYWLNLDWKRHQKSTGIVLRQTGKWNVPIITPEHPDTVLKILEEKTGIKPVPEQGQPSSAAQRCSCGASNDIDAVFCKKCGTRLKESDTAQPDE